MSGRKNLPKSKDERRAELAKRGQEKLAMYRKAKSGDGDAIMETMYERGMISKDSYEDYKKIKEQYG